MCVESKAWFLRGFESAQAGKLSLFLEKVCRGLAHLAIRTRDTHAARSALITSTVVTVPGEGVQGG